MTGKLTQKLEITKKREVCGEVGEGRWGRGEGMIFPHLGQDPMFGLIVPLPKKGLQIMSFLKCFCWQLNGCSY
jgi:hypothetical protein